MVVFVCVCVCVCVWTVGKFVCTCVSVLMEAYFPSESTLLLSGEINANTGSGEDGRNERNDKKGLKNKQRPGFKERKERERVRE